MSEAVEVDRPLAGLRILDAVSGPLAPITRYLAELGATVTRTNQPQGHADPFDELAANHGKQSLDFEVHDPRAVAEMIKCDAIVFSDDVRIDLREVRTINPAVVTMTASAFGTDTSYSGWHATDPVLHALSGELSRSGIKGRPPLLPPGRLAMECAGAQAAYVLVTAIYAAIRSGKGAHYDFSALDGAVQALDPGYGISGSATMGKPAHMLATDRPARGFQYPIFPCADGYVRLCLLAKRQWQGMFRWMGEPAEFASPEFEKAGVRYKSPHLLPAIAAFFADRGRGELEREGQAFGVPIAALLSFTDCVASEHMRTRHAFTSAKRDGLPAVSLPNGMITIDGTRMGPGAEERGAAFPKGSGLLSKDDRPFAGLRVLDLGVIVVGAEQGRLLADGGADVVKVESRANPDGNRQSYLSYGMSVSFAAGHRNKRSLGIDLRAPEGRDLFLQLARASDVVLSNFKPGTMQSLGLGPDVLLEANPRLVLVESSAFGNSGPWSKRMGYGPLVRAATGLTELWRYPDDPDSFSDSITIYPDHVAARIGAIAAIALLIRRERTGRGGAASIAQAEVMLGHFAADVARASVGIPANQPPDWPWGVYRAAGEDQWCVISVRGMEDWKSLASIIQFPGPADLETPAKRLGARDAIDAAIGSWLSARDADQAMVQLQAAGVPAARMLRLADLPNFGYYKEREFYREEAHPYLREVVLAERWAGKRVPLAEAPARPAPLAGEHTAEIVAEWLDLRADIDRLIKVGVLEPLDPGVYDEALKGARGAIVSEHAGR
jgi:crotonobetainyl-CoA:carnitine CoA-transferase CaiB-like acyl-CoA transferase